MTVTEARHAGRPLESDGLESVSGVLGARPETGRSADRDREMVGNDEEDPDVVLPFWDASVVAEDPGLELCRPVSLLTRFPD